MKSQLEHQQSKSAKKSGRSKEDFYFNGKLLTDADIAYYVEGNFLTITKLERDVGAKKNQLRNRYKRYKEKQQRTKEESAHGNC